MTIDYVNLFADNFESITTIKTSLEKNDPAGDVGRYGIGLLVTLQDHTFFAIF